MQFFVEIKKWLAEITEIALLLIALGVAVEILFGNTVPFFGQVVGNITALLKTLGDNGLVGLIALGIIVYLFNKKRALA
jgi:ABC-type enterochelin transport system permease subunit